MHLSEILTHLGEERGQYYNAVSPPVIQTSNFTFSSLGEFRQAFTNELTHHIYSRGNNPTVAILRQKLAALEGAEDALVFASGMGAISAAILANVEAGGHVVCVESPYSWARALLRDYLPRFGVTTTFVDGREMANIGNAIRDNTTLLYLESPNSLTFELQDIRACAELARHRGITTILDNSYSSPVFQRPLSMGIDIVVHSGTKYLNGHSDVVMGVLCASKAIVLRIFEREYMTLGGILPPHDAALAIRGLRTLELRMHRSNESALKIARYLGGHPKVAKVLHPLLPSFPQYELATKQMEGAGGLFSIYLKADSLEKAEAFYNNLEHFLLAVSWGGHESLVLPSAAFYNIPGKADPAMPWNLVRLYIGLEDPDWLLEGLEKGLAHV
ncbi:MAG: PLP-dependent transferase [Phaeodactylibacter sp.]|nr:PLP-dependent transferase [Phaeodactylibacter sp.]MCB9291379.1 PLP-dependent transferase [Lewinellaceae bacterium]